MKLKDCLSTEDLIWVGKLEEKIKNAKSLDEIDMYKHHLGCIMRKVVYKQKIKLMKGK